jgi:hypothetical protein
MSGVQATYPYWLKILIGIDQLANALCNRDPNKTISYHLGEEAVKYNGTIPWLTKPLEALIYRGLEHIDPGHCAKALKNEEVE